MNKQQNVDREKKAKKKKTTRNVYELDPAAEGVVGQVEVCFVLGEGVVNTPTSIAMTMTMIRINYALSWRQLFARSRIGF